MRGPDAELGDAGCWGDAGPRLEPDATRARHGGGPCMHVVPMSVRVGETVALWEGDRRQAGFRRLFRTRERAKCRETEGPDGPPSGREPWASVDFLLAADRFRIPALGRSGLQPPQPVGCLLI